MLEKPDQVVGKSTIIQTGHTGPLGGHTYCRPGATPLRRTAPGPTNTRLGGTAQARRGATGLINVGRLLIQSLRYPTTEYADFSGQKGRLYHTLCRPIVSPGHHQANRGGYGAIEQRGPGPGQPAWLVGEPVIPKAASVMMALFQRISGPWPMAPSRRAPPAQKSGGTCLRCPRLEPTADVRVDWVRPCSHLATSIIGSGKPELDTRRAWHPPPSPARPIPLALYRHSAEHADR